MCMWVTLKEAAILVKSSPGSIIVGDYITWGCVCDSRWAQYQGPVPQDVKGTDLLLEDRFFLKKKSGNMAQICLTNLPPV